MKQYLKVNEDICDMEDWEKYRKYLGSADGSLDELIINFRSFYKEAHLAFFNSVVKEVWLEQQITVRGVRRKKRMGNGHWGELSFGKFTKIAVGMSHRVLTASFCFTPISTYLIDFFPDFLLNNPFKNPEKYQYPYKHITLDFLVFVYQMDNRLELLEEAERRQMSYAEFINWATNWFLCYNMDVGRDVYSIVGGNIHWFHVKKNSLKKFWENDKYKFDTKK